LGQFEKIKSEKTTPICLACLLAHRVPPQFAPKQKTKGDKKRQDPEEASKKQKKKGAGARRRTERSGRE